jgi:hypothetical protein
MFSDTLTVKLMELTENYILKHALLAKIRKKVSYLVAESFQNIIRHSVSENERSPEVKAFKDYFQISIREDRVIISSANIINNNEIETLEGKIDLVNALSPDELDELYSKILTDGSISKKGGASLGLIEMVRKSGSPLARKVKNINENYSQFLMSIEISIGSQTGSNQSNLEQVFLQYEDLLQRDAVLMYKGDFSNASNTNLVEIVNKNLLLDDGLVSKKIKNVIAVIELIQNVSKHGKIINNAREGLLITSEKNADVLISCSNYLEKADYQLLKEELILIKSMDLPALDILYKKRLGRNLLTEDGNSGLGLIELARFTKNEFTFNFHVTQDDEIFYTINLKI